MEPDIIARIMIYLADKTVGMPLEVEGGDVVF